MRDFNFISVSGYGWSGSGAYVSLLKEFYGFGGPDGEFRLVKDPFGLIDLESSLVNNWDFIRHDVSIRDFLWFCNLLSRKGSLFGKMGLSFEDKLFVNFFLESENYIDRLTDLKYVGDSVVHRYRLGRKNFFLKQIRSKLGISNNTGIMRLSRPDKDKFIVETRNYIYKLFNNYATKYNLRTIVLDQAIPISNHMKSMNYFDSIKLIKVDRDPRDIYVNLIKRKKLIGFELAKDQSVDKYISWHRTLREKSAIDNTNQNILTVNFEDLSLDYKSAVSKLSDFIGDDAIHKNAGKKFDPKLAIKNIGLWKSYKDQRSIDKIYEAFPDDCFDI
jgi:hypothetical protein